MFGALLLYVAATIMSNKSSVNSVPENEIRLKNPFDLMFMLLQAVQLANSHQPSPSYRRAGYTHFQNPAVA